MRLARLIPAALLLALGMTCAAPILRAADDNRGVIREQDADADFAVQGEYTGVIEHDQNSDPVAAQVIAQGDGKFKIVGYIGGLPGDGWNGEFRREATGRREGDVVRFTGENFRAELKDGVLAALTLEGDKLGELKKVVRKSPTEGKKPPEGAVILFDGTSADAFSPGRMDDDKLLMQGAMSKRKFGDFTLHLEFKLSYAPKASGQGRSNSGFYAQGRHEVQILDSFGLEGKDNECGGLYTVKAPKVNMCYPPLSWQTYDVDFTAAKYEGGKKTADARMTVRHNGVLIQDDVAVPKATTAAPVGEGPEPGPIFLQDHGNEVRFRNIWVVEKK